MVVLPLGMYNRILLNLHCHEKPCANYASTYENTPLAHLQMITSIVVLYIEKNH